MSRELSDAAQRELLERYRLPMSMRIMDVRVRELKRGDFVLGSGQVVTASYPQGLTVQRRSIRGGPLEGQSPRRVTWKPDTTMRIARPVDGPAEGATC